jgi:hypothetical protein
MQKCHDIYAMHRKESVKVFGLSNLIKMVRWTKIQPELALIYVLCNVNELACKDPLNKAYGIRGLLPDAVASAILPKYGTKVRDVYIEFAVAVMNYHQDLWLLSMPRLLDSSDNNLPSWVPDWRAKNSGMGFCWVRDWIAQTGWTGAALHKKVGNLTLSDTLLLRGTFLDQVVSVFNDENHPTVNILEDPDGTMEA